MRYTRDPQRAAIMLNLCHEGNNIYEVTCRRTDGTVQWSFAQAETPKAAEAAFLMYPHIAAAVPRQIRP